MTFIAGLKDYKIPFKRAQLAWRHFPDFGKLFKHCLKTQREIQYYKILWR